MKYKFKPQRGIVVAGLLAGAYAQACYYQATTNCKLNGNQVDTVQFQKGAEAIYASANWFAYIVTMGSGSGGYSTYDQLPCSGPAKFTNWLGHSETISYWETEVALNNDSMFAGLVSGLTIGTVSGSTCD